MTKRARAKGTVEWPSWGDAERARRGIFGSGGLVICAALAGALSGCHSPGAREAVVDVGSHPEAAVIPSKGVCSSTGYCWENPLPVSGALSGVWSAGTDDVYAVGDAGQIVHFDGKSWQVQPSGTDAGLTSIWGSGPNDVFVVGDSGTILHRSAGVWKKEEIGDVRLESVWGSGPNDVFAVGWEGDVYHYDGHSWTGQSSGTNAVLQVVWGSGPKDVYAVGFTGAQAQGVLVHYDGSSWDEPVTLGKSLCGVWGTGPNDVWVAGTDDHDRVALWRRSGSEWKPERVPKAGRAMALSGAGGKPVLLGFVGTSPGNDIQFERGIVFAIAESGGLWERRDLLTVSEPIAQPDWTLRGDAEGHLFAAGWWGVVGRFEVGAFGAPPPAGKATSPPEVFHALTGSLAPGRNLTGVWGTSPKDVIAVGVSGTILHHDAGGWSADPSGKDHDFTAIHGAGGTVAATARGGALMVRRQGRWTELDTGTTEHLSAVWTNGPEIFAVGAHGTAVHCEAARCTPMSTGVKVELWSVFGTSRTEVFAAGAKGTMLRWDGASWKIHAVPPGAAFAAVGSDGQGGVIALNYGATYRFSEGAWTHIGDGGGWAMSDGGDGESRAVWGGGGAPCGVSRFDGKKWHEEALSMGGFDSTGARLSGVWSGGGEVFIVGDGGTILHRKP